MENMINEGTECQIMYAREVRNYKPSAPNLLALGGWSVINYTDRQSGKWNLLHIIVTDFIFVLFFLTLFYCHQ